LLLGFKAESLVLSRALELALMRVGLFPFAMNLLSFASKKEKKRKFGT
jgi:hypothetical protein